MASALPPQDEPVRARLQDAVGGRVAVDALLGRGGFGIVFAATASGTGEALAIKLLRPDLAAPLLRERFRREAASAARLQHPHVVPVLEVGEHEDLSWFLMPRIAGETLRERLAREGRLPIGEARRIFVEIAGALAAAHEAGILHRDVKPDNILLEAPMGRALLTDFGIAKSLDGTGAGLTTAGAVVGTPQYMSPEQAGGEPVIGPQSDLYSLGVVAYQMLTGVLPFEGTSAGAILMRQLRGPAGPVARARSECPRALALAVDRCLCLEPGDRWQDAADLLTALGRPSGMERVAGAPPPGEAEARRFRWGLLAYGLVLVVAAAVDFWRGVLLAAPLWVTAGAAVLAGWYGSLWTRGHSWRSLLLRQATLGAPRPTAAAPTRADQARSDRAFILKKLTALPRVERGRYADLPAALDRAVLALEDGDPAGDTAATQIGALRAALLRGERFGEPALDALLAPLRRPLG